MQHPLCIFWCPLTLYSVPSTLNVLVPPIGQKKNFMSKLMTLVFQTSQPFSIPLLLLSCHFVIPCQHSHLFIVPHLFIIFNVLCACFCHWLSLSHSQTKTTHQFEFWMIMFKFGNICYINTLAWDVFSKPWPSNNHIDLKAQ